MGRASRMLACVVSVAIAVPAAAQEAADPPDPATITMPDMTPSRDAIENGWKFFYFQKPGVTYAEAYADISECYRFFASYGYSSGQVPSFMPWVAPSDGPRPALPMPRSQYGLIGDIMVSIAARQTNRRDRIARMRRCMEPRWYVRYPLREEIWHQLVDDYSPRTIAMQALAASGPVPDLPQPTR
jgi:hypothetical protein